MTDTLTLSSPVEKLKGVGQVIKEKLNEKNIFYIEDLLFVLPYKYEDRTKTDKVDQLYQGKIAQCVVYVINLSVQYGRQKSLLLNCEDETGYIDLRLFHFSKAQMQLFSVGSKLLIYGQVSQSAGKSTAQYAMMHPEIKKLNANEIIKLSDCLTPVYPSILGIGSARIKQWVDVALTCLFQMPKLLDFDKNFLSSHQMNSLKQSLKIIHQPPSNILESELLSVSNFNRRRLAFDELLAKQIGMMRKKQLLKKEKSHQISFDQSAHQQLMELIGFKLTQAQIKVNQSIFDDLNSQFPMQRLLQGDVGSGKTIIAFSAVMQIVSKGMQAVIMAPTEVLAEQHFKEAKQLFLSLNIRSTLLVSKQSAKQKKEILLSIKQGEVDLIIGTHALFQEGVGYHRLALVIIDEQHRFGVHQRLQLKEKAQMQGYAAHFLIMTATPIPRTLAMSHYGDLDTSVLDELPPNRKSIKTVVLADNKRNELIERITSLINLGQQVYWICPLIETSDVLEAKAAEVVFAQLDSILPNISVGLLHGKQKSEEKEKIIQQFTDNKIQLLVSTTVVEVGVNVPNATLMVIENAERFGLAQLHQLRGRVGRGADKSYCVLLYQLPLSETAKKRLAIMKQTQDGFLIAQKDLEIRGAGEVLGTKQTGEMLFKIANLSQDEDLLVLAHETAEDLLQNNKILADAIAYRWLGHAEDYLLV